MNIKVHLSFLNYSFIQLYAQGFPGGSEGKASACNAGDPGSIPGLGRSLGERNGNPLQYSCLENPIYRGACWATVHGVAESDTTERRHFHFHVYIQLIHFAIQQKLAQLCTETI